MDVFAVAALFFAHQLDSVLPSMVELVPAFKNMVRKRRHVAHFLYPGRAGRCFCRQRLRCACPATVGEDGRCVTCLFAGTCDCLNAPMQYELEVMPSVPEAVFVASEAMLMLRLVDTRARTAFRQCMLTHVGMQALVKTYRASALVMAGVLARESVVGMRVGCCVGECSLCHGSLHECVCGVFSCECAVCVWLRHIMYDPPTDTLVDLDDDYRGDKPERFATRTPAALPPRDPRHDARLLAEYTRLRLCSFLKYSATTPAMAAEERFERAARGSPVYDESLDSDFEKDTDEYE